MRLRQRDSRWECLLRGGLVLGRSPRCDAVLSDASISRRHARIEERGGALWLVDLASSNGIQQNGRRAAEFPLRPGDLVTLGGLAFDVLAEDGDAPPPAAASPGEGTAGKPAAGGLAAEERLRIRAELQAARRSRGLGDLGQQPAWIRALAGLLALALCAAVFYAVRLVGDMIAPR